MAEVGFSVPGNKPLFCFGNPSRDGKRDVFFWVYLPLGTTKIVTEVQSETGDKFSAEHSVLSFQCGDPNPICYKFGHQLAGGVYYLSRLAIHLANGFVKELPIESVLEFSIPVEYQDPAQRLDALVTKGVVTMLNRKGLRVDAYKISEKFKKRVSGSYAVALSAIRPTPSDPEDEE